VLPALVCLDVSACGVSDSHLAAIGRHCPRLRALDASRNPGVSDNGVAALAAACQGLLEVDLSDDAQISDGSLCALAAGCRGLQARRRRCRRRPRGGQHGNPPSLTAARMQGRRPFFETLSLLTPFPTTHEPTNPTKPDTDPVPVAQQRRDR
jgi:hypothetical protein